MISLQGEVGALLLKVDELVGVVGADKLLSVVWVVPDSVYEAGLWLDDLGGSGLSVGLDRPDDALLTLGTDISDLLEPWGDEGADEALAEGWAWFSEVFSLELRLDDGVGGSGGTGKGGAFFLWAIWA